MTEPNKPQRAIHATLIIAAPDMPATMGNALRADLLNYFHSEEFANALRAAMLDTTATNELTGARNLRLAGYIRRLTVGVLTA